MKLSYGYYVIYMTHMKWIRLSLYRIQKVDTKGRDYPQCAMNSLLIWAVMMKRIDSSKV